ncbi:MAG: hypothetical protein ABIJ21_07710 [Nanoarchaeota archaeon]
MEAEIEEWFEQEKERISAEYMVKVKKSNNQDILKLRPGFERKMKKLIEEYNRKHERLKKNDLLRKKLHYPVKRLRKELDTLSGIFAEKDE